MPCGKCDETLYGVAVLKKKITNVAASVRQRLLNLAQQRKEDFGLILTKYALERILFRVSQSEYRPTFVLKGALLFELWTEQRYRPTRDADFLARGENSPERFQKIFREICAAVVPDDGLSFDPNTVKAERIVEDANYPGVRITFIAHLENARISLQVDIGSGDVITPAPTETEFPTMLDFPAPTLFVYSKESVVAEKFEAMVNLGITNSRMKDFHDVRSLSYDFSFNGPLLSEAILNTFTRRKTPFPTEMPLVFTPEFYKDDTKIKQWNAFCKKNSLYLAEVLLETVCLEIAEFLIPIIEALKRNERLGKTWPPRGPWKTIP